MFYSPFFYLPFSVNMLDICVWCFFFLFFLVFSFLVVLLFSLSLSLYRSLARSLAASITNTASFFFFFLIIVCVISHWLLQNIVVNCIFSHVFLYSLEEPKNSQMTWFFSPSVSALPMSAQVSLQSFALLICAGITLGSSNQAHHWWLGKCLQRFLPNFLLPWIYAEIFLGILPIFKSGKRLVRLLILCLANLKQRKSPNNQISSRLSAV